MKRTRHSATRRTTLTLPESSLREAERIARSRNVNLSTVVAEALGSALEEQRKRQRVDDIMESYRQAFQGLDERELMILDGIIPEKMR